MSTTVKPTQTESFLTFLKKQNLLANNTIKNYDQIANFLKPYLRQEEDFLHYCWLRQQQGIDNETLNKYLKVAKWWCRYRHQDWAFTLKRFPIQPKNRATLTLSELQEFTQVHTDPVMDTFWWLHAYSGTRPTEVANLRLQDFDLFHHCFYPQHTKTNDGQPIIFFDWLLPKVVTYLSAQPGPYAFSFRRGETPISLRTIQKDCQERLRIINCPKHITPHSFRHTYATIGITSGQMPVQYVQRLLRHHRISTTMHYLDRSVDFMLSAAAVHPYAQLCQLRAHT